jgi:hypothetical protein
MVVESELAAIIDRAEGVPEYPVVFNYKFVDAFVSMIPKGGSIRVETTANVCPARITSDDLPGWECVLMPMQPE